MAPRNLANSSEAASSRLDQAIRIAGIVHAIANRMTSTGSMIYGEFGLGFLEARLLYVLATTRPMPAVQLVNRLKVDPSAVSRAVHSLIKRDLVERAARPERVLRLTVQGAALAKPIRVVFEQRCLRLAADLSPAEIAQTLESLRLLEGSLDRVAGLIHEVQPPLRRVRGLA